MEGSDWLKPQTFIFVFNISNFFLIFLYIIYNISSCLFLLVLSNKSETEHTDWSYFQ